MLRPLNLALAIALTVAIFAVPRLSAQESDRNTPDRHTDPICTHSAYMHGYIHGYEQGFHVADLEIHLGRPAHPLSQIREYSHSVGYHRRFGDSGYFNLGYKQGFRAAYSDARRGAAFRGIEQLRNAETGFPDYAGKRKELDQAISGGYDAGYNEALRDPHVSADSRIATERCIAKYRQASYCEVYAQGFRVGYADASVNQLARETQTAKK